METSLDALTLDMKAKAFELLARCLERNIPLRIINTLRTEEEQVEKLKAGLSWTKASKHLIGEAIDVCPYSIFELHGENKLQWNANDPIWQSIGQVGESLGLMWGGRWPQRDMGHFQLKT